MYFTGTLSIDPAQVTRIRRVQPQRAFKRILYFLTLGAVSDRMEQETFTAVSILQQLYQAFDSVGVNNLIRLSHDDIDFYLDEAGKDKDLKAALDRYELETNAAMSQHFNRLQMVVEHSQGQFRYLIGINIHRNHSVGKYPIDIRIDGLFKQFEGGQASEVEQKMRTIFADQDSYNSFVRMRKAEFDEFIGDLDMAIRRCIPVTDTRSSVKSGIIIPKKRVQNAQETVRSAGSNHSSYSPVYHNYHNTQDSFFYAYLWADMCHDHQIHVQDTRLYSDEGLVLGHIGEEGVAADQMPLFDTSQSFEERLEAGGLEYNESSNSYEFDTSSAADTTKGWFGGDENAGGYDSGSGSDNNSSSCSSSGSDSGGSSCSSGSSCGSSCGSGCSS